MTLLDQAVETIGSWEANRTKDRARSVRLFKRVVRHMDGAIAIWEEFLQKAPERGDRFTAVLWMGPRPAKSLQALYLKNKATAVELTDLTGVRFKDSLSLAEDLDIVQPYDQLKPGETGVDRAEAAIRIMTDRKQKIEAAISSLGG
ncbi:MAG TPA: hypothetical protein VLS27_03605 [Gammaproteobacteria bacterium]|nr:hypothetical protein [Gammaproteobacteria bacterium]